VRASDDGGPNATGKPEEIYGVAKRTHWRFPSGCKLVERPQSRGDNDAVDSAQARETAVLLYERLRALARLRMSGERSSHTLDATGLTNEAILRLLRCEPDRINDENHFFALAAEAMRRVLVEHARARGRRKRGGGQGNLPLDEIDSVIQLRSDPAEVIAMDEALSTLEIQDAQAATIVKLRSFAGMDPEEIAALLGISRRTIERRWRFAMAKLRASLSDEKPVDAPDEPDES